MSSKNIYISEKYRELFIPTYLMIKQHQITGKKYLCKTAKYDPYVYKGSGKYWLKHIKKYGLDKVDTIWCELFDDIDNLVEFALFVSEEFDIINSNQWANLRFENGLDGAPKGSRGNIGEINGMFNKCHSEESKQLMSVNRKGKGGQFGPSNARYGKSGTFLGKTHSIEAKQKMRKPKSTQRQKICCVYCKREIAINAFGQHIRGKQCILL